MRKIASGTKHVFGNEKIRNSILRLKQGSEQFRLIFKFATLFRCWNVRHESLAKEEFSKLIEGTENDIKAVIVAE